MNAYAYLLIFILAVLILVLIGKVFSLKKSAKEIEKQASEIIKEETNTVISVSSADKDMRSLASTLNDTIKQTNDLRHKYSRGDEEIKKAITNISHDLRTPLTAIIGYLDLLKKEEKSEKADEYLDIIENRAESMKKLTSELFSFSVGTSPENEADICPVDACAVLEESLAANYTLLSEKSINPEIKMPESLTVLSDREMLLRIFGNIISNAAKYSDGDLKIEADESGEIRFSNKTAELTETRVAKLFDRFYTVNDARNSTGLGLSIAKSLARKTGGEISADYANGTLTITVKLCNK